MPEKGSEVTVSLPKVLGPEVMKRVGDGAAHLALIAAARIARARWLALAHERLRGHGQDLATYVAAIGHPVIDGNHATIRLVGDAAAKIEAGRPRVDLRDVLLGDAVPVLSPGQMGRGKRMNRAGGYYRAIPLPPRGGSFEAPAAVPGAASDATLGQELAAAARRLGEPTEAGAAPTVPLVPQGQAMTTDPMARLYGQRGVSAPPARGGPVQFRTISTSRGTGWIMRPKPGADIMRDLEKVLARDVSAAIGKMLAEVKLPGAQKGQG